MSDEPHPGIELTEYNAKLQDLARQHPHHGAALVRLAGVLADAGAMSFPTQSQTVEEALGHLLLAAADAACEIAATPPTRSSREIRELLVGLVELTTDPDHGTWDGEGVTRLRERARELLLVGA